ncbi:CRISPR-associated CARF protein Csx1 [Thermodesulforhabdus norvegica]|uniref:CRISPR-associated protein Csx1 n=1 Tax=Thermodesulforhabdus norvegica TaxID=39841 RepID=A0A1I4TA21_9BACT|nr:CRISPR-associated CARF protein Csx1 [Thermodesulforhabdus norvegica]SFM73584.1 CRISPR-associated protein Csx1 [Thermodesulforhabdus norvegica]
MSYGKNVIYQIGRLDKNIANDINFKIEENLYAAPLSSFALKKYFEDSNMRAEVILCYPVSLLFDSRVQGWDLEKEFKEKIGEIRERKADYFRDPLSWFRLHPHSAEAEDILVLHSIGEYEGENFFTAFEVLVLEVFFHMLERYLAEPYSCLYLDISSGLNIYVSALVEAGRLFSTFYKLSNWKNPELGIYLVFSDPILGTPKKEYNMYRDYKIKTAVFFSAPEKIRGENDFALAKSLAENRREVKRKLQDLFSRAYLFFSAIQNNIPLALYTFEPHSAEEIELGLKKILELGWEEIRSDYQKNPHISKDIFIKGIFLLALYKGIVATLEEFEIHPKKEVSLSEIKEKFCNSGGRSFYDVFGLFLNPTYLKHEVSNNFEKECYRVKFLPEWRPLHDFLEGESRDLHPRNFIAHCGFERNCVEVKKNDQDIFLRYKEVVIEKIKKILWNN